MINMKAGTSEIWECLPLLCHLALGGLVSALFLSGVALAQNRAICVQCIEPNFAYRCEVEASPQHQAFLANDRLKRMACIRQIAKASGHAVCKVSKDQPIDCAGQSYSVDISQMAQSYLNRVPSSVRNSFVGPRQAQRSTEGQGKNKQNEPPKTVVELAERTAENSQKQLENAGAAVKDAGNYVTGSIKQTWTCLASLFQDC